jgi:hypothetical protein
MTPVLLHLHGFKCAGSTFKWILEKNFPRKVLYVESLINNTRLDYQKVALPLEKGSYRAISSHLISRPRQHSQPHPLTITFLRNPSERLMSAFAFQKATNSLKEGDVHFRAFLTRLRLSQVSNYQSRLLSPQTWIAKGPRHGWELNPRAVDLNDENLFVGTVEKFDQSMVLLEGWLKNKGVEFDASYSVASNTGMSRGSKKSEHWEELIFPDMVEIDELLWTEVTQIIESKVSADLNFSDKMIDFTRRKEAVEGLQIAVAGPDDFIRI